MPTINRPKKKDNRTKNSRNKTAAKMYNTTGWKKLREGYLMQNPICEMCGETFAMEVHHIKPILTGTDELEIKSLLLNPNNLMALCTKCHHLIHKN